MEIKQKQIKIREIGKAGKRKSARYTVLIYGKKVPNIINLNLIILNCLIVSNQKQTKKHIERDT